MADIPLRILFGRLQRLIDALAFQLSIITNGSLAGITYMVDLATFRAQTGITLASTLVILLADANGNSGIFKLDPLSIEVDDGIVTVVDASARRWTRQQAPV